MVEIVKDDHSKNIKSTLETNNLDEFLSLAKLSQKKFEVLNEIMVMQNINGENKDISQNEFSNVLMKNILKNSEIKLQESKSLAIPKRPKWKEGIAAKEFERMERESFLNWRRELAEEEEKHMELAITPFEKNIEIWRQLWLVVEKSQILIQIVDGRNPLFFRSPDLENYIKEVNKEKEIILLVNKADLLTQEIRRHWAEYFKENGIKYIFFSALIEGDKIEKAEEAERVRLQSSIKDQIEKSEVKNKIGNKLNTKSSNFNDESDNEDVENIRLENQFMKLKVDFDEEDIKEQIIKQEEKKIEKLEDRTEELKSQYLEQVHKDIIKIPEEKKIEEEKKVATEKQTFENMTENQLEEHHKKYQEIKVLNREELIEYIKSISKNKTKNNNIEHFYIGFIGYPNVGKSSVINVLMKKKRVN